MAGKFRLLTLAAIGLLPSPLAVFSLRVLFRYKIGRRVRIGFSVIDAAQCEIGDDVSIGHLNVFTRVGKLSIGESTRIGALNVFRGGDAISIGRYCDILRLNEINSIPDPELLDGAAEPRFVLGDGSMIGASHKIDFTDRVTMGKRVILGGRNSSIWTHNRQQTEPVEIGDYTYLGSEIRIAPGASVPAKCIVGMGSVVAKRFSREYWLIAGVPATEIKELDDDGRFLTERKTRRDLPDDI